jgi:hypothetical protein
VVWPFCRRFAVFMTTESFLMIACESALKCSFRRSATLPLVRPRLRHRPSLLAHDHHDRHTGARHGTSHEEHVPEDHMSLHRTEHRSLGPAEQTRSRCTRPHITHGATRAVTGQQHRTARHHSARPIGRVTGNTPRTQSVPH